MSEYEEVINLGTSSTYDDMMNCVLKKMPKVIFFDMNSLPKKLWDLSAEITK